MSMPVHKQIFDLSQAEVQMSPLTNAYGMFEYKASINPKIQAIEGCSVSPNPGAGIQHTPKLSEFIMGTGGDIFTSYSQANIGEVLDMVISGDTLVLATSKGVFTKTDSVEANPKTWAGTVSEATIIEFKDKVIIFPYSDSSSDVAIYSDASVVGTTRPDVSGSPNKISFASEATGAREDDEPDGALIDDLVRGPVKYFVSFVNSSGDEGALSISSDVYDAKEGDSVRVTVNTVGMDTTSQLQIYRTYAGRHQGYAIPQGRIPITAHATDDTFLDQVPDSKLGELPLWHGDPPPKYVIDVIPFAGRLLALAEDNQSSPDGTTSELFISDPDNEASWWTVANGNRISVGSDSGDIGTALIPWGKNVLVAQENHMHIFSGRSSETFRIDPFKVNDPRDVSYGLRSKSAYVKSDTGMYFFFNRRIYHVSTSGSIRDISEPLSPYLDIWVTKVNFRPIPCLGMGRNMLYVTLPTIGTTFLYSTKTKKWLGSFAAHVGITYHPRRYFNLPDRHGHSSASPIATTDDRITLPTTTASLWFFSPGNDTVDIMSSGTSDAAAAFAHYPFSRLVIGPFFGDSLGSNKNFLYADIFHTFSNDQTILRERVSINSYGEYVVLSIHNIGNADPKSLNICINRWYESLGGSETYLYDFSGTLTGAESNGRVFAVVLAYQEYDSDSQ